MNTAILTLHFYNNFGSVLQAYALRNMIHQITDQKVDIIPFRPKLLEYTYFQTQELQALYEKKKEKFCRFRERELGMKDKDICDMAEMNTDYDAYVVGSDIIWGKEFSGLHPAYFLDFVPKEKRKIAYAASMMLNENGGSEEDGLFKKYIPSFDAISVRETTCRKFIQNLTGMPIENVLDPSFLLQQRDYKPVLKESAIMKEKAYLLSYFLTHDPAVVNYTNLIAKKLGLRVIHYFADYPKQIFDEDAKCFAFADPGEFLGYIKNAACVFTNSFHGTCFSIIYQRPFYTYTAKRRGYVRIVDLIRKLKLEDRCFQDFRDLNKVTLYMEYHHVNEILSREREWSIRFLKKALGDGDV